MRIIPAIDIIDGKCVRLSQGDYNTQKVYSKDPLDMALQFQDHGIRYLHLVDLDGAKSRHIVNHKVLEKIAVQTDLHVDFGGGLKSDEDLKIAFESGASQITGGSIAVTSSEVFTSWLSQYGSDRIILGADAKEERIAINGWKEESEIQLLPFIRNYQEQGVKYVICTDISRDGMLEGPSVDLYGKILRESPGIQLVASGGISSMDDIHLLEETGCEGAIIGKAIYEGKISLKELEQYVLNHVQKLAD